MAVTASSDERMMVDEAALIARVGRGDQAAFRALVDAHAAAMHRLAWRMLFDAVEAEDVVQEAFTRLWTGAPRWRAGHGRVGGWLYRVCTNLCLDRLRRRRFADGSELDDVVDERVLAPDAIDRERLGDAVAACLAALPDRQRAALVLTYYDAVPNAAAADMLDMKLKAFESLLFRARAAMRAMLEKHGIGAEAAACAGAAG